jgi:hypothetical protein
VLTLKPKRCDDARNWSSGRCRKCPGRRSASTRTTTAAPNCSTRSSTRNCPLNRGPEENSARLRAAASRPGSPAGGRVRQERLPGHGHRGCGTAALRRPLVDGSKRLALAAVIAFYGLDGGRLALANDSRRLGDQRRRRATRRRRRHRGTRSCIEEGPVLVLVIHKPGSQRRSGCAKPAAPVRQHRPGG